jgi:RHS repeat-associated protein
MQKPQAGLNHSDSGQNSSGSKFAVQPPNLTLPQGGGSLRGMGEKFAANPVTGTGAMTIPLALTPGRDGFEPKLDLSYDSGAGNGPFGMGWRLSLPQINRKTDKGLPYYLDGCAEQPDGDVFVFSDLEDLVPCLAQTSGQKQKIASDIRAINGKSYQIRCYRPRVESAFSLIERWISMDDPTDMFWRTFSQDNILTLYGKDENSRIFDPLDPKRIFSWLICEVRDDKGNGALYEYKAEDGAKVDLSLASEANRGGVADPRRTANRYLKRVLYGNSQSLLDQNSVRPPFLSQGQRDNAQWLFELVFDYGEYGDKLAAPTGGEICEQQPWPLRPDCFSSYRPGFELRTCRLCRRAMMFHHIPDVLVRQQGYDGLVHTQEFIYSRDMPAGPGAPAEPVTPYSFLSKVGRTFYKKTADGSYLTRVTPPIDFTYSKPAVQDVVETIDAQSLENLPIGLDSGNYQWIDLHGEGIPGILAQQGGAWYYKGNLSPLGAKASFAPAKQMALQPSILPGPQTQLLDLAGDGRLDFVVTDGAVAGFYKHDDAEGWQAFRPFPSWPHQDLSDPNIRLIDLDGDGHADILITEQDVFIWHPSLAENGFGPGLRLFREADEEHGPRLVFSDQAETIFLSDMSGDGLTDLIRIRNGEVCYWPNLGYGRFGARVAMDNSPRFDHEDYFDPKRIRLADIDGSGTTDILYLHRDEVKLYFNCCGNGWSCPQSISNFPLVDNLDNVAVLDLLGNGTACLVWSSPLPTDAQRCARYIDLMGEKPHLLVKTCNNMGCETLIEYASSAKFYLQDKLEGKPWATKLPFPVHVVTKTEIRDKWRQTSFSSSYSYHHGYFDGFEREFRGFGRVEQVDVEDFGQFAQANAASPYISKERMLYQPPVKTVTWYHVGAYLDRERILAQYRDEYFNPQMLSDFRENRFMEPELAAAELSDEEWREALRACKGKPLRQEVYELDVQALTQGKHGCVKLFTAQEYNYHIKRLQAQAANRHAVFLVAESENITYHYELDLKNKDSPQDKLGPDPRIVHQLNLQIDQYANVLQSVAVVYPRLGSFSQHPLAAGLQDAWPDIERAQQERHLSYSEIRYTNDYIDTVPGYYRLRVPCETLTYELGAGGWKMEDGVGGGATPFYYSLQSFRNYRLSMVHQSSGDLVEEIPYHVLPNNAQPQKRLVEQVRVLFFQDDGQHLSRPLPLGKQGRWGLTFETYKLALTNELLSSIFGKGADDMLAQPAGPGVSARQLLDNSAVSGYLSGAHLDERFPGISKGQYWLRSGIAGFSADADRRFLLPDYYTDPFGQVTQLTYEPCSLIPQSSTDAAGNRIEATRFDYRSLLPSIMADCNQNHTEVAIDLTGMVIAMAVKSKDGQGDNLGGYDDAACNLDIPALQGFFVDDDYSNAKAAGLLGNATSRYIYYFGEAQNGVELSWGVHPPCACSLSREKHLSQANNSPIQAAFAYSDSQGAAIVNKIQAEPAAGTSGIRWLADGKTIVNNKGNPVKKYEPYFSDTAVGHRFEEPQEAGVTSILYYDAVDRLFRTDMPDGTFSQVEFSPWYKAEYDANDTVLASGWFVAQDPPDPQQPLPQNIMTAALAVTDRQRAAWLAAQHANTPTVTLLDSLGREVFVIAHNIAPADDGSPLQEKYLSYTKLDAEGKPLWIKDARGNLVMQYIRPNFAVPLSKINRWQPEDYTPAYDIAGNLLFEHSMDAGGKWMLFDAAENALVKWQVASGKLHVANEGPDTGDGAGMQVFMTRYDMLRRPLEQWLTAGGNPSRMVERVVYGESLGAKAAGHNLRGQLYRQFDQSGAVTFVNYDFKGNLTEQRRQLALEYKETIDWQEGSKTTGLEAEVFAQIMEYNALNNVTRQYRQLTIDNGQLAIGDGCKVSVMEPVYNQRNLLERVVLWQGAVKAPEGYVAGPASQRLTPIASITYDAKGQRQSLLYGNGSMTRYYYDPLTFRLQQLRTTRPGYDLAVPGNPAPLADDRVLQDLHYTYDPVGNITEIRDQAFETAFFKNQQVEPKSLFTYDALYRLVSATGREDMQTALDPPGQFEQDIYFKDFPIEAKALANYCQNYRYDAAGNMTGLRHHSKGGSWTKQQGYAADSNRLLTSRQGNAATINYRYDSRGNMLNLANTVEGFDLSWNYQDMLSHVNRGGGGVVHYTYNSGKTRTRKVALDPAGNIQWERIYLDGFEVYRKYKGGAIVEEIETLHLMDGDSRFLQIEDVIQTDNPRLDTGVLLRYQYSNHLGSAVLELDGQAKIISYEEYHPYGTAAYRAISSNIRATANRYRYTGKERDEESGLYYHGARYYAAWLGRWTAADPAEVSAGLNLYEYCFNNPMHYIDLSGLAPGQLFNTQKDALENLFYEYFGETDYTKYEFGYSLYKVTTEVEACENANKSCAGISYSYLKPVLSEPEKVKQRKSIVHGIPESTNAISYEHYAYGHSHPYGNNFSGHDGDLSFVVNEVIASGGYTKREYLLTPEGNVKEINATRDDSRWRMPPSLRAFSVNSNEITDFNQQDCRGTIRCFHYEIASGLEFKPLSNERKEELMKEFGPKMLQHIFIDGCDYSWHALREDSEPETSQAARDFLAMPWDDIARLLENNKQYKDLFRMLKNCHEGVENLNLSNRRLCELYQSQQQR